MRFYALSDFPKLVPARPVNPHPHRTKHISLPVQRASVSPDKRLLDRLAKPVVAELVARNDLAFG